MWLTTGRPTVPHLRLVRYACSAVSLGTLWLVWSIGSCHRCSSGSSDIRGNQALSTRIATASFLYRGTIYPPYRSQSPTSSPTEYLEGPCRIRAQGALSYLMTHRSGITKSLPASQVYNWMVVLSTHRAFLGRRHWRWGFNECRDSPG